MNVDDMLETLEPPAAWTVESSAALRRFHAAGTPRRAGTPAWYRVLAATAALAAVFLLPAVRSGAQQLWQILHAEQVTVLKIPQALPPEVAALSATVPSPAGVPAAAAGQADAERQIGFRLRLPRPGTLSSEPHFLVVNPGPVYDQLLDRAKFQAAVDSLHRSDLVVPPAPSGASIRVGFSPGAAALYGQCQGYDCDVTLSQTAAPTIAVSDGVDLGEWLRFSLQLAGVSASDAVRYAAAAPMKTVLPVVFLTAQVSGGLSEVQVGGAPAVQAQARAADGTSRSYVVWISGGRLYSLSVRGSADFALTVANSLE